MNNEENVQVTDNQNTDTGAQATPETEAKPTSMADVLAALTIQYPGYGIASAIEDDATINGELKLSRVMQDAIENDVFVQPRIKSVDFWDTHKGGAEVSGEVFRFLDDGIKGNLE